MEETISLQEIFATIRKRLGMIIIITVLCVAAAGVVSYFILNPVYQASSQILVNQKQSDNNKQNFDQGQVQANQDLVNTYSVIVKSPAILDKVVDKLNLHQTSKQLSEKLTVNSEEKSQVFNVSIENEDPAKATKIVNTVAAVFQKQVPDIMNVDNVSLLSKADLGANPSPVKPRPSLNMAIALVVGLMISVGLAFLLEYLDNTIKSEEDIEQQLGLPVLGAVTEMNDHKKQSRHHKTKHRRVGGETFEA